MRARPVRLGLALFVVSLAAACTGPDPFGRLALEISAPAGVEPRVEVTGPGFDAVASASGELIGLPPGTYRIDPIAVEAENTEYAGFYDYEAASVTVSVVAGETTAATVDYGLVGMHIPDAEGDADGSSLEDEFRDALLLAAEVFAELTLRIEMAGHEEPGGLSDLVGVIDIDADGDASTGNIPFMNLACDPVALGTEAFVTFAVDSMDAVLETSLGAVVDLDMTVVGNIVTITVPLAAIGSPDGRVHVGAVIGSPTEPTDCVPGAAPTL